jgi:hypothetical protein
MPSPSLPSPRLLADGFPSALEELRHLPEYIEPGLVLGLLALLQAAGMSIRYSEADVISGHAGQLIYRREHPECAQLAFVPPMDTLFRALDVTWKEVTPSGPVTAYEILREWLQGGKLVLARLREPLLIYGYVNHARGPALLAARLQRGLPELLISLNECDTKFWRYPLDEGNLLVRVEHVPKRIETLTELARTAARRAVRAWHTLQLAGCATGDRGYRQFVADLRDADMDFTGERSTAWMGVALWTQWTSRFSLGEFYDRVAPRFAGADRAAITKASFCYAQSADAWKHFTQYLGPTWNHNRDGFGVGYPEDFIARWRNSELRIKGSHWVEEARGWEEKAVLELTRVIR